jgi:hypothetical protein
MNSKRKAPCHGKIMLTQRLCGAHGIAAAACLREADCNMADELPTLATTIKTIEEKIEKLEQHIVKNDFAGTPYDDRAEAKAALTQLNDQLKTLYDTRKIALTQQQQQQGGAGSSMLPMRQEAVLVEGHAACYRNL